jgi:hypothetical protein
VETIADVVSVVLKVGPCHQMKAATCPTHETTVCSQHRAVMKLVLIEPYVVWSAVNLCPLVALCAATKIVKLLQTVCVVSAPW